MSTARTLTRLRHRLAAQAGYCCGYCQTSEKLTGIRLTIDHLIPRVAGGKTEENNLWVACSPCNEFKGAQTHALDPLTGETAPLFNPRTQVWREHFEWDTAGTHILGLTAVGRATVVALQLNHDLILHARRQWVKVGWHPPELN